MSGATQPPEAWAACAAASSVALAVCAVRVACLHALHAAGCVPDLLALALTSCSIGGCRVLRGVSPRVDVRLLPGRLAVHGWELDGRGLLSRGVRAGWLPLAQGPGRVQQQPPAQATTRGLHAPLPGRFWGGPARRAATLHALFFCLADVVALYGTIQNYASIITLFIVWSVVLGVRPCRRLQRCAVLGAWALPVICSVIPGAQPVKPQQSMPSCRPACTAGCNARSSLHRRRAVLQRGALQLAFAAGLHCWWLPALLCFPQAFAILEMPLLFIIIRLILLVAAFQVRWPWVRLIQRELRPLQHTRFGPLECRRGRSAAAHHRCRPGLPAPQLRFSMARLRNMLPPTSLGMYLSGVHGVWPQSHWQGSPLQAWLSWVRLLALARDFQHTWLSRTGPVRAPCVQPRAAAWLPAAAPRGPARRGASAGAARRRRRQAQPRLRRVLAGGAAPMPQRACRPRPRHMCRRWRRPAHPPSSGQLWCA